LLLKSVAQSMGSDFHMLRTSEEYTLSYKKGFEHFLFLKILALSIPKGAAHICEDTPRRTAWLQTYPHLLTGSMLLAAFAYAEGLLGKTWIEDQGANLKRELECLRIIRNAITHHDGAIRKNRRARGLTSDQQHAYVKEFIQDMLVGSFAPLSQWPIEKRKSYILLSRSGIVKLGPSSYGRIGAVVNSVLRQAGVIKHTS